MNIYQCLALAVTLSLLSPACASTKAAEPPAALTHEGAEPPTPTIASDEARALVSKGAKLVDVRSPEEFAEGHIEGAVNLPVDEVSTRADELGEKHEPVILYCMSGRRAHRAAEALRAAGFTKVHELGAMSNWQSDPKPANE